MLTPLTPRDASRVMPSQIKEQALTEVGPLLPEEGQIVRRTIRGGVGGVGGVGDVTPVT